MRPRAHVSRIQHDREVGYLAPEHGVETIRQMKFRSVKAEALIGRVTRLVLLILFFSATQDGLVSGQICSILHNFGDGSVSNDGSLPLAGVIQGSDGNFYGVTDEGGSAGEGTIISMTPGGTVTILHNFGDGTVPNDGQYTAAGLIRGVDGNFYGTTSGGGSANYGTVFNVTPSGVVTILHSFNDGSVTDDGKNPSAKLIQATDGNFYGTTPNGGAANEGTAFKMTPSGVVTILHSFGDGSVTGDGLYPSTELIQGTDGNFYGTTQHGGSTGFFGGTVYKMTPAGVVTILHSFGDGSVSNDGLQPIAGLVQGTDGSFYGTTSVSSKVIPLGFGAFTNAPGSAFKITPQGVVTILHSFGDGTIANDGQYPSAALIQATDGSFYGTTENGGFASVGTIFRMTSSGAITIMHSFGDGSVPNDGSYPAAPVFQASDGNMYGTTEDGGSAGTGTLFKLIDGIPSITSGATASGILNVGFSYDIQALPVATSFAASNLPSWLTLNTSTGVLSGIPDAAGVYTVSLTATNAAGTSSAFVLTIGIASGTTAPKIYSASTAQGDVGSAFAYAILASPPASSFSAADLPSWLSLDASSGILSGTPSAPGTFAITLTATNAVGTSSSFPLTITVTAPATGIPVITSGATGSGYVGGTFTYLTQGTPSPTSFAANNLPSWLYLNPTTGLISGIPPASAENTSLTVTLTATNASGTSSSFPLQIHIGGVPTVAGVPVITSLLQVFAGDASNGFGGYQITATNNPTSFSEMGMPSFFTLSATGQIDGAFSLVNGTYQFQITATNAVGSDTETLTITVGPSTPGYQMNLLHSFGDGSLPNDGNSPNSFFATSDGSLFGTTATGGNSNMGTFFFSASGTGTKILESLAGAYGITPVGMTLGTDGNYYGVSSTGGTQNQGAIFKVDPFGVMTVLHSFGDGSVPEDGSYPAAALVEGPDGNFYGTTQSGGSANLGTLFVVTPSGAVTILHNFDDGSVANDGANPTSPLTFVPNGSFYLGANGNYYADGNFVGTTRNGGSCGLGNVFAMTTQGVVTNLHNFGDGRVAGDGIYPMAGITLRSQGRTVGITDGNLYGTTCGGGTAGKGTIFCISPSGSQYSVIHSFGDGSTANDGSHPQATFTAVGGTLYSTTKDGGANGDGTIFAINPTSPFTASGTEIIYSFGATSTDGAKPASGVYVYQHVEGLGFVSPYNDYYGVTSQGGIASSGTLYVYEAALDPNNGGQSGQVVYSLASGSPPLGMTVSSVTGDLIGSPLPSDPLGLYTYTVDGYEGGALVYTNQTTMTMGAYSSITTTALPSGTTGSSYSLQLAASNTPTSFSATGLPPGLTCTSSGLITGTLNSAGAYSVVISATNSLGKGAATTLTLSVTASTPANSTTTDTPTMPPWALVALAMLLIAAGSRIYPEAGKKNSFSSVNDCHGHVPYIP
jgi:uncharacterized repeat protein (TIGR03803 family)